MCKMKKKIKFFNIVKLSKLNLPFRSLQTQSNLDSNDEYHQHRRSPLENPS